VTFNLFLRDLDKYKSRLHRFVGYIIRFIHNRDKVEMGILLGYAASKMGFAMAPERVAEVKAFRFAMVGTEPTRGFLLSAENILDSKLTLGGTGTNLCFYISFNSKPLCRRCQVGGEAQAPYYGEGWKSSWAPDCRGGTLRPGPDSMWRSNECVSGVPHSQDPHQRARLV
jgi:hypothetical protein